MTDTIYALSSAPGKAGVAVVRVSGPGAFASLKILARLSSGPVPRQALFKPIYNPKDDNDVIDQALILPFKGPGSFTGEDVVEYHLHGSPAVLNKLLSCLSAFDGHRPAEHGEYTRRAFENDKLDLTEAEAVADLINAETEIQRQQALLQMDGALSKLYEGWRERLIKAMAYIETVIDFPDEDIPDDQIRTVFPQIEKIIEEIEAHTNDNGRGERLRDGIRIAIIGAPNAGKSSLLNALAKRDVAIVSATPGTTRDVIEAHLDLGGYPVIIADTAGLREKSEATEGHDAIESEGIRRALRHAHESDLRILVFDGTDAEAFEQTIKYKDDKSILIFNKLDAPGFKNFAPHNGKSLSVSAQTGQNLDALIRMLTEDVQKLFAVSRETPSLTRTRHRAALEECIERLKASLNAKLPELMAEDVRMAARSLGRITGRIDVEDLLDVIFRDFCIGK